MDETIHHLAVFISRLWQIHAFGEFRNSLVRANYNNLKNGIHETTGFLELFLENLLLNEKHPLHNRTLHISGTFKNSQTMRRISGTRSNAPDRGHLCLHWYRNISPARS